MTRFPSGWNSIRMGGLFRRRDERGRSDLPLLSVYRDLGVVPREGREDNFNRPGEDLDAYRVVRPGDLVLNKMKTWQGSLGVSAHEGIVSPAYFVAEQVGEADARFLHHLLRSRPLIAEYGARSKGIRPSQWDLPWDEFKDIRIALPSGEEQRAIADFLDRETARIDALISRTHALIARLIERRQTVIDHFIANAGTELRIRHVISRLTSGPRGWAQYAAEEGRLFLRITNVQRMDIELDLSQPLYVNAPETLEANRTRVRLGDVLVSITADIGSVGVAREEHVGASVSQHVALLSPSGCSSEWLAYSLSTSVASSQLDSARYGGTKTQLGLDDVADVSIHVPSSHEQEERLQQLNAVLMAQRRVMTALSRQSDFLRERRQALITAAVTGQMDIPSAA